MASRGGGKKGGGKPTARSQNYLRQYGYPSERELRREAQGLAGASVPTIRSVQRPYQRQMQSTRDFLAAVQSALADTSAGVGSGYDQAISQSQAVDQAAQARLAGLGLGAASAGVQAAAGARGDAATQNLISNAAAAKNYAAQLPAVAAGSASRQNAGLQKNLLDALANLRDSLSQAFFQALQQVQGMHLQEAGMVQSGQQFQQNLAQQASQFAASQAQSAHQFAISHNEAVREFNLGRKDQRQAAAAGGLSPSEYRQQVGLVGAYALPTPVKPQRVTVYKDQKYKDPATGKTKLRRVFDHYSYVTPQGVDTRNIVQKGTAFPDAVQYLQLQGVSMPVILSTLGGLYDQYSGAPNGSPAFDAYWSYREFASGVNPYVSPSGSQRAHRHR